MKAKDYAKRFNDNPSLEVLSKIATSFLIECLDLAKARNAKSDIAMFAVFDEQDRKWKALARRVSNGAIKEDGFELLLKDEALPAWAAWRYYKIIQRG